MKELDLDQINRDYRKSRPFWHHIFDPLNFLSDIGDHRRVADGYLGVRTLRNGDTVLVPPGIHGWYPGEVLGGPRFQNYNALELSEKHSSYGRFTLIRVDDNEVAYIINNNKPKCLTTGHYILKTPEDVFKKFVSLKDQIKYVNNVRAYTEDKISLTFSVTLIYSIIDVEKVMLKTDHIPALISNKATELLCQLFTQFRMINIKDNSTSDLSSVITAFQSSFPLVLKEYGLELKGFSLYKFSAVDPKVNKDLADLTLSNAQLMNDVERGKDRKQLSVINSEIKSQNLKSRARGANSAANQMKSVKAENVFKQQEQNEMLGTLATGNNFTFFDLNNDCPPQPQNNSTNYKHNL